MGWGEKNKLPKMRSGCSLVGLQSHCVNKGEAVQLRLVDFIVCLTPRLKRCRILGCFNYVLFVLFPLL